MFCPIRMENVKDVHKVSNWAAKSGIDMVVSTGNTRIDPRSLLELFNFVGQEVLLVAPDDTDPDRFMTYVKKMGVLA